MAQTIVERDSSASSNGLLVGVLLAILLVVLFFILGGTSLFRGFGGGTSAPSAPQSQPQGGQGGSVDINVPEEINVNTPN